MLDLYLIRYFLAVVETGSFTKAAEQVSVTQPTLSAGIKKLEEQLGKRLFDRSQRRRIFLTKAGTVLLPRAKAIWHECNMVSEDLADAEPSLVIRLGVLTTIPTSIVSNILSLVRQKLSSLTIEIQDGSEHELSNRLDERSIDFALSLDRGQVQEGLATGLFDEGYRFVMEPSHPLAQSGVVRGEQFSDQNMIVRSRCEVLRETSRYFTDRNVRPRLAYRTTNDERALRMVEAGVGATVIPESYVRDGIAAVKLKDFDYRRTVALFFPRYQLSEGLSAISDDFVDLVKGATG